ncbi:MAG: NhaA family Na+:H+ antiporter, partial [Halieaceae bacterium]
MEVANVPDREQALIARISRPLLLFSKHKLAGAGLLLISAIVAIVWANSIWSDSYFGALNARLTIGLGDFELSKPVLLWINDGMMGVFFFVVGLEVKREFLAGELSTIRKAMLPIAAAIGGMVVPAAVFYLVNYSQEGAHGWGIPMATDIAFALGVLALYSVPIGLKVFLTALAIVDDIGSIIVIAFFYTDDIAIFKLLLGGLFLAISAFANKAGVRNPIIYFLLGCIVWLLFLKSGVHATLAAVLMAFTIPARSIVDGESVSNKIAQLQAALSSSGMKKGYSLLTIEQHHIMHAIEQLVEDATAPLQELEHALMPFVTFLVLPIFAFANAGIALNTPVGDAISHPVTIGIVLGLFVGKPLGIFVLSWIAVRSGVAELPAGVTWQHIFAVGILAG